MSTATDAQRAWVARVLGYTGGAEQTADMRGDAAPRRRDADGIRLAKSVLLWNETRGHAREQVKALQAAIRSASSGHRDFGVIDANVGRMDEIFDVLDDRLTQKLGLVQAAASAEKQTLMSECRDVISEYRNFVESDWLMLNIDANGFVPLDIHARVSAALSAILADL